MKEVKSQKSKVKSEEQDAVLYDADARQRFVFEITENGEKYETAHVWKPLEDARYVQYLKDGKVRSTGGETEQEIRSATVALWREQIENIENVEIEEGKDFRDLVDFTECEASVNHYLAVAIVEPEEVSTGVRKLASSNTIKVITEAFFNGKPIQQTHLLKAKNAELWKKFDRLEKNQWKQERIGGGLKLKARSNFVPQVTAKGELYDEMQISATGFKDDNIPVRFKAQVVDYIFASQIQQKK